MSFSEVFLRVLSEISPEVFFFFKGSSSVVYEFLQKFSQEFFRSIIFRSIKQKYSREVVQSFLREVCLKISRRYLRNSKSIQEPILWFLRQFHQKHLQESHQMYLQKFTSIFPRCVFKALLRNLQEFPQKFCTEFLQEYLQQFPGDSAPVGSQVFWNFPDSMCSAFTKSFFSEISMSINLFKSFSKRFNSFPGSCPGVPKEFPQKLLQKFC